MVGIIFLAVKLIFTAFGAFLEALSSNEHLIGEKLYDTVKGLI